MIISDDILHIITLNIFFNYNCMIFIKRDYKQNFIDVNENDKIILKLKVVVDHNQSLFENIFNNIIIEEREFLIDENIQFFFYIIRRAFDRSC